MKTNTFGWVGLGAFLIVGCGGGSSNKAPTTAKAPPATTVTVEKSPEPAMEEPAEPAPKDTTAETTPAPAAMPVEDKNEAPQAAAKLTAVGGTDMMGTISFVQNDKQVTISGTFTGLKPGFHGIQIKENGVCTGKGAKDAGKDFNPGKTKHGSVGSTVRHLGDFGNVEADADGNASFSLTTDSITVVEGVDSVVGKAVVITAKKDDGKSQPSGKAGDAVACGVIQLGAVADITAAK